VKTERSILILLVSSQSICATYQMSALVGQWCYADRKVLKLQHLKVLAGCSQMNLMLSRRGSWHYTTSESRVRCTDQGHYDGNEWPTLNAVG